MFKFGPGIQDTVGRRVGKAVVGDEQRCAGETASTSLFSSFWLTTCCRSTLKLTESKT